MSIATFLDIMPNGQVYYWARSRRPYDMGNERAILWHHGAGGETLLFDPAYGQSPLYNLVYEVCEAGYTILSCDFGGAETWGNNANQQFITDAVAWLPTIGCRTDKVGLWGLSMGFACLARWATNNASKVAAFTGTIPAASTQYVYDNNPSLQAGMNAAFGGNWQASQPSTDPSASLISSAIGAAAYPFRLDYSDNDPVAGPATSPNLVTLVGRGDAYGMGNVGHTVAGMVNIDPTAYIALYDGGLW